MNCFRFIFITPSFRAEARAERVLLALAMIIKTLRAKAHLSAPVCYSALKDGVMGKTIDKCAFASRNA
jgi:hypothetical protein